MALEGVSGLTVWSPASKTVVASVALTSLMVVATGVALVVLQFHQIISFSICGTGGALLSASILYSLVLSVKECSNSSFKSVKCPILDQLNGEEMEALIFDVLTETDEERKEALDQLSQLSQQKSKEDTAREYLYRFSNRSLILQHLIEAVPNLKAHLTALDSDMIYECLTNYAMGLTNTNQITQVFLLLNDAHRCTILNRVIEKKKLFLALIAKAPATTHEELRKKEWPELFHIANELLSGKKEAFYPVYASLCDEHQKVCMKRILQESKFKSQRIEMMKRTQGALLHPFEFIEYALGKNKEEYCGKINPSLSNETTKLFDALLPTLPKLHIVTFFWRIAREKFKVWSTERGWTPRFKGTPEEKEFFKSLSFEQVARLNETGQPWIALWHPSEQSDETIIDACFQQLKRVREPVTEYADTEYSEEGKLFKKNGKRFLDLLSLEQLSMLICRDPNLTDLNQIFGFERVYERVPKKLLKEIPHFDRRVDFAISIPAILERWWRLSLKQITAEERVQAIQELHIEDKYIAYFTHMHHEYEKSRPFVEAAVRELEELMQQAGEYVKEGMAKGKSWGEFIQEKHAAKAQAEFYAAERRRAQREKERLFFSRLERIEELLNQVGLDPKKEHSRGEITAFIKKEMFKCHPDRNQGKSEEEAYRLEECFKMLSASRDELFKILDEMGQERTPVRE